MRDHYPETIVPESRPGDPNTAVREISTEQAAREEALVERWWRRSTTRRRPG